MNRSAALLMSNNVTQSRSNNVTLSMNNSVKLSMNNNVEQFKIQSMNKSVKLSMNNNVTLSTMRFVRVLSHHMEDLAQALALEVVYLELDAEAAMLEDVEALVLAL